MRVALVINRNSTNIRRTTTEITWSRVRDIKLIGPERPVFQYVYRDGDRNAAAEPELIELQCTVQEFEEGSEKMRQVTTVAGATSITLRCEFKDKGGNSLLERDITGKVRFFGGNLTATYDFAKKAANIAAENFSAVAGRNSFPARP
jgi:hypothetical protein